MARVKIKIKHLILLGVIAAIPAFPVLFPSPINYALGVIAEEVKPEVVDAFYERSIRAGGIGAAASASRQLDELIEGNFQYFDVYLSSRMGTMGMTVLSDKDIEEFNKDYVRLKGKNHLNQLDEYGLKIAVMNFFSGNRDEAIQMLAQGVVKEADLDELRRLHLSAMYLVSGNYDEGYRLLTEREYTHYPFHQEELLQSYYFLIGDTETFMKWSSKEDSPRVADDHSLLRPIGMSNSLYGFLSFAELEKNVTDRQKGDNRFVGEVKYYCEERPALFVSLDPIANFYGHSSHELVGSSAVYVARVQSDGTFAFNDLPDGQYSMTVSTWSPLLVDLNLNFSKEILEFNDRITIKKDIHLVDMKPKIHVEEEKLTVDFSHYEEIESMDIYLQREVANGSGTYSYTVFEESRLEDNHTTIDLTSLTERQRAFYFGGIVGGEEPSWEEYLPPFYLDDEYRIGVRGYDEAGKLIFDSSNSRNQSSEWNIFIKGKKPDKADEWLLEGKVEDALPLYEESAEQGDEYALTILANLYGRGYIYEPEKIQTLYYGGRDVEKGIYYLKELEKLYPGHTDLITRLSDSYESIGEYEQALKTLMPIIDELEYGEYMRSRLLIKLGNLEEALTYINHEDGLDTRYLMINLLLGHEDEINQFVVEDGWKYSNVSLAKEWESFYATDRSEYQKLHELVKQGKIEEAQEWLSGKDDDYGYFYQGIFDVLFGGELEERSEAFHKTTDKIEDRQLNDFLLLCVDNFVMEKEHMDAKKEYFQEQEEQVKSDE